MDTPSLIGDIASESATIPDIRELLAHIHNYFGGTQEYARMLVEDVKAAPEGSNQRLSFHNNYIAAVAKFGGNDDLDGVTPAELEAEAKRLLQDREATHAGD